MADKQQISLFRIALDEVKGMLSKPSGEPITNSEVIDYIVSVPKGERRPKSLQFTGSTNAAFKPYKVAGYFVRVPTDFPWSEFFEPHLAGEHETNAELLSDKRTYHKSFFVFIFSESSIYCFSGGLGYHFIKDFVDDGFGISVLEAFKNVRDTELSKLQSRNIVGNVASDQRTFRDSHRAGDEQNIGRIYRSAVAKLPYSKELEQIRHIVFDEKETKKNVVASQSFRFSTSLNFKQLKLIVDFFENLKIENRSFAFSPMKPIKKDKAHSKFKIESLNKRLNELAFDLLKKSYDGDTDLTSNFYEASHKHYDEFYSCDRLVLKRRGNDSVFTYENAYGLRVQSVLNEIATNDREYLEQRIGELKRLRNKEEIVAKKNEIIGAYSLDCYLGEVSETSPIFSDKISQYFTAEVTQSERTHFYVDGSWYLTDENFISGLNSQFTEIYNANNIDLKLSPWGEKRKGFNAKENENTYLEYLVNQKNSNRLVLHRIKPQTNMELCDFLTWDKNNIYICHVKPSFDGNIRILINQIQHACKMIQENLRTGLSDKCYLAQYFNSASKFKGDAEYELAVKKQFTGWDLNRFYELFSTRNIHHTACIVDPSKRSLTDIEEFDSNIAKLCVVDGYRGMRVSANPNSRFLLYQIPTV